MKCDDFLPSLETGSIWQRARALWHARGCHRCAGARENLRRLQQELSRNESISPYQRRLWEQALPEDVVQHTFVWSRVRWGLAAAIVLVVATTTTTLLWRNPRTPRDQGPNVVGVDKASGVIVRMVDPAMELASLETKLTALEAELAEVPGQVERAEVQQQVAAMIQTYSTW
jgi:hypothetical protein